MFKKFQLIFIFLNLIYLFDCLSTKDSEIQQIILNRLDLKRPPITLNVDRMETSCMNFLKSLRNNDKYNEIDCFDLLKIDEDRFIFPVSKITKFDKFAIRLFRDKTIDSNIQLRIGLKDRFIFKELTNETGWLELDVTELISKFKNLDQENIALNIDLDKSQNRLQQVGLNSDKYRPFLVSFIEKNKKSIRSKRGNELDEDEEDLGPYLPEFNDRSRFCEAVPIYYKFEDYGWNSWIISPKGYSSNFCQGRCSFPLKSEFRPTNHAIVQSLMQLIHPDKYPEPCCAPDKTDALQIVYFDNNVLKFKRLTNLVIKSCRCV